MTTKTAHEVEYTGYDPRTGRCSFSVPASWGTGIPIPNARLIAAAPELLSALEQIATQAESGKWPGYLPATVGYQLGVIARAAIIKATAEGKA